MSVVMVDRPEALLEHVPAWERLAVSALEPNVFYEPWMFLPALRAFGPGTDFRIALVFASDPSCPRVAPLLCAVLPVQRQRCYKGLPLRTFRLWQHKHCFLGTPLLRPEYARESLTAFLDYVASDPRGASLLEFARVPAEGLFQQLLADVCRKLGRPTFLSEQSTRGLLCRAAGGEDYIQAALSGDGRRNLKRRQRRLADTGQLTFEALEAGGDVGSWVEGFLRIEASGWKGQAGTALACNPAEANFFRVAASEAFRRGRLLLLALRLDGKPLAYRCSFLAGEGSFAFKTAYDEAYAHHSPGVLLELENIFRLHALPRVLWMDSCTSPDNGLINRLWKDRRAIHTVTVATGRRLGDLVVRLLPVVRWLRRKLRVGQASSLPAGWKPAPPPANP